LGGGGNLTSFSTRLNYLKNIVGSSKVWRMMPIGPVRKLPMPIAAGVNNLSTSTAADFDIHPAIPGHSARPESKRAHLLEFISIEVYERY
jgi:hypothetical protein